LPTCIAGGSLSNEKIPERTFRSGKRSHIALDHTDEDIADQSKFAAYVTVGQFLSAHFSSLPVPMSCQISAIVIALFQI